MTTPILNMTRKYHAIQSSAQGVLYVQDGHVFHAGGAWVGPSLPWDQRLFTDENGQPTDPYNLLLTHATEHKAEVVLPEPPAKLPDEPLPDVEDVFEAHEKVESPKGEYVTKEEPKAETPKKKSRFKKSTDVFG